MQNNEFGLLCFLSCSSTVMEKCFPSQSDGNCFLTFNETNSGPSLWMVKDFRNVVLVFCISFNEASECCLRSPIPVSGIHEDSEKSSIIWYSVITINIFYTAT